MHPPKKPKQLRDAISELIAVRGLARAGADTELREAWIAISGDRVSKNTRVIGLKRSVLEIAVFNSAMLSELASFQKHTLLKEYKKQYPKHGVKDIRFKLESRKSK